MSSDGQEKWKRHFSKGDVKTYVRNSNGPIRIFNENGHRINGQLANNTSVTVLLSLTYNRFYKVRTDDDYVCYVSQRDVMKPPKATGASESLSLKSVNFVAHDSYLSADKTSYTYDDAFQLIWVVKNNMRTILEQRGRSDLYDVLNQLLVVSDDPDAPIVFQWPSNYTNEQEKNELGKCFAEILTGLYILAKKSKPRISFPVKHNNALFDVLADGKMISVKYGKTRGASASIFGLLDEDVEECCVNVLYQNRTLSQVQNCFVVGTYILSNGNPAYSKAKSLHLLKCLQRNKLDDAANKYVSECFSNQNLSEFVGDVTRCIARHINSCEICRGYLQKKIEELDIWEVYVDNDEWLNGKIQIRFLEAKDASIVIDGSKSAKNDPKAKQGTLSFRLTKRNDNTKSKTEEPRIHHSA